MENNTIYRQDAIQTAERMYKRCDTGSIEDYHDLMIEALTALPSMDAVPVAWIEDEIKELNEMDNLFSTLTANLLSAMLGRWKEREGND